MAGWSGQMAIMNAATDPDSFYRSIPTRYCARLWGRDHMFGPVFEVRPGQQFWARFVHGGATDLRLGFRTWDLNGNINGHHPICYRGASWVVGAAEAVMTMPEGCVRAQIWLQIEQSEDSPAYCYVTQCEVRRVTDGVMIRDGAITAGKIAAGSVTADKLAVNSLSAISANLGSVTAG